MNGTDRLIRLFVAVTPLLCGGIAVSQVGAGGTEMIYLLGDAGEAGEAHSAPVLRLLDSLAHHDGAQKHTLVFLGDNLYPRGLHKKHDPERVADEVNLDAQIAAAVRFPGHTVFVPGNHDWQQGGRHGWKFVVRQEKYIEDTLGKDSFLPEDGCPGPEVMDLGNNAVLIFIDTQWWLQKNHRPEGGNDGCDVNNEEEFLLALADKFKDNRGKRIILAAHHPIYTFGNHGGYYSWKDHLFPLRELNKDLWIPLPIIGSIYPGYRKLVGNVQDVANVRYGRMSKGIRQLLRQYPGTIYAAGHEHNLQFLFRDSTFFIGSGAGSKSAYLAKVNPLLFGAEERGFARLAIDPDGSTSLDFFTLPGGTAPAWTRQLEGPPQDASHVIDHSPRPDLPDSITVVPNADLDASKFHRFLFGNLYRNVWAAPVKVPVLWMDTAFGGLTAIGAGGGFQTRSLKLKAGNGHEYVLRSIRKYPGKALSPNLRGTVVQKVVDDGIAANFPYGALAVPPIAHAAHVLHADPRMVYAPDDPNMGKYRDEFANTLCLLEEHLKNDWSDTPSLGSSKNLVSSSHLMKALRKDHDAVLDERALVRARLLDMLLGDWDGHDGNWRWATYEMADGKTLYKPIPIDRDEVFFTQDGLLPSIIDRKWLFPQFQPFGPGIRNMGGLNYNARYLDRAYLTGLDWPAWKSIADSMRSQLTDSVFQRAGAQLPDTAVQLMGGPMMAALKGRRDRLEQTARRQYLRLARFVNVVGTDKDDRFTVRRLDDERTEVEVFNDHKKRADEQVYHRIFLRSETRAIRLYGLAGKDKFQIEGDVRKAIKVRIIEGEDRSEVKDLSRVKAWGKHTLVYADEEKHSKRLDLGKDSRLIKASKGNDLEYDRREYLPDVLMPVVVAGFNKDDGIFLGGGASWTTHRFKAEPFKWRHRFAASAAWETGAYHLDYQGEVNEVIGPVGFGLDAALLAPNYRFNFFGYGNRSERPGNDGQFRYRIDQIDVKPYICRRVGGIHSFKLGGHWSSVTQGTLSRHLQGVGELKQQVDADYAGGFFNYTLLNVDNEKFPRQGVRLELGAETISEIHRRTDVLGLNAELRTYSPLEWRKYRGVLAMRMGIQSRNGQIDPITAASVGGDDLMRGLLRGRFSGNLATYGNIEVRSDLFTNHNAIIPFRLGLITLADAGRVWVDGMDNNPLWHHAIGAGIYISPFNMLVLQATYAVSDDDGLFDARIGFFF